MKNRYLSTRIMAIMMAAAMAVSAAPAAFAAERADSETIKEDNLYIREALKPCLHLVWKTAW